MSNRRVVVTGFGAISPLGNGVSALWDGLINGRSGIGPITRFDSSKFDVHFGGECSAFDAENPLDVRQTKRMDRFSQLALVAASEAVAQAGITDGAFEPTRAGAIVGTGIGGIHELETQVLRLIQKGPSRVSAFTIPKLMANAHAGHISIAFNLQGISDSVATACASAGNAMGDAVTAIRNGRLDVVVTGGAEAALSELGLAAFAAMKALSTRNDDPEHASRPWDKDRDGFVLSEGAGMLVFEEYEHAKQRGAPILCEVLGGAASSDANDMVQPDPRGLGAARAMRLALEDAGVAPEQVDYINAHATSTTLGDTAEVAAIKSVFGGHAKKLAVSSTKSVTGHTLGASGGIEAIAAILAIQNNTLPPTINLNEPDEGCDLDFVPHTARDARVDTVLSNSFGFGGHNACILFRNI